MRYTYSNGTNRLESIRDLATGDASQGFDTGTAPNDATYGYDGNGNLTADPYKNLDIAYNHLNLPDTIIQPGSNNRIVWFYDVAGNKLRKEVYNDSIVLSGPLLEKEYRARFIATDGQPTALDSTMLLAQDSIVFKPGFHAQPGMRLTAKIDSTIVPVDQTDYIGGIEYRNLPRGMASSPAQSADSTGRGGIQAIYHPEGRAVPSGSNWRHEYVITDHLGNTRLRFSDLDGSGTIDSTELLSTHDYYPFGLEWNTGGYKYTFNGKEKNVELGLDWLDYGARWLDPVTGRWNGVDPLAEKMPRWSVYNYSFNNPVRFVDPDGMAPGDCCGGQTPPSAAGILFEAIQNARAGLYNLQMRTRELLYGNEEGTNTRMRVNYNMDGSIPVGDPVRIVEEPQKGALSEVGDAALDVLSLTPLTELGMAGRGMSAPFLAAKSGGGNEISSIFRAVSQGELDDITNSGLIRPGRNTMEVKLFTENIEDAVAQGVATGKEFSVIEVMIPNSTLNKMEVLRTVDKHIMSGNTIAIQPDKLDLFNSTLQSIKKVQ